MFDFEIGQHESLGRLIFAAEHSDNRRHTNHGVSWVDSTALWWKGFKQVLHAPLGRSAALSAYEVPEFWVVVQDFQVRVIHGPSRVGVA